ncbi:tetratricopeptide repeat protein [Gemmatimonas sp.]|uniref:tetratricopeptide repeat protein n=1 Tax=Gemmatimonas sp. TaxID=1962908 RepID=UPI0039830CA1
MNRQRWRGMLVVGVTVAGGAWWYQHSTNARARVARAVAETAVQAEFNVRSADIAFFEARVAADPQGSIDRLQVGTLYLQRARERNDYEDYLRAERSARSSLAIRQGRNGAAYAVLASSLLAQHRFIEARDAARRLVEAEPGVDGYLSLLGETCLEAGDYAGARDAFAALSPEGRASLAVAPRLARWAEIRGDTASARRLFRAALNAVTRTASIPREQAAWFFLRASDLELRQGRLARATAALDGGLQRSPSDHRLLAAAARLAAVRHDWRRAIELGDSAIAVSLDPATLGIISDAYAALGDSAKALEYFETMEVAVGQQPGTYHRAWSLYLLDHGRSIPAVLEAAQAEIVGRPDVYGYDLLAWALHKSGHSTEARAAIGAALAQGTQDAMLYYHAGMIERAAGNVMAARNYLERALRIAPDFDHAAPMVARRALAEFPLVIAHRAVASDAGR